MAIAPAAAGLPAPTASIGALAPFTPSLAFLKRRCATALRDQPAAAEFLAAFPSSQPGAEALASPEQAVLSEVCHLIPADQADASLLWVAQEHGIRRMATLDRRDFGIYRLPGGESLDNLLYR
jgi:predicted nucleic acid-binding protein